MSFFIATTADKFTQGLLTNKLIDSMKKTAIILNVADESTTHDKQYVLDKVANKQLGGYGFEGYDGETIEDFVGNVLVKPSIAYFTKETFS